MSCIPHSTVTPCAWQELERLDPGLLQDNVYIKHPVALEQFLMEGAYNRVILSRSNVPAESYTFFIDLLLLSIRLQICSSSCTF